MAAINNWLMIVELNRKLASQFEHFFGENPKCVAYLWTWGEASTIKLCQKMTPKFSDHGKTCMMIGYAHLLYVGQRYGKSSHVTRCVLDAVNVFFGSKRFNTTNLVVPLEVAMMPNIL